MTAKQAEHQKDIISTENELVLQIYRRAPFVLESGHGAWVRDMSGREYLDAVSGVAVNALGHGDPEVVETIKTAGHGLIHVSNLYHSIPQTRLARSLVDLSFADRVFYCNSGAESVESALKFARKYSLHRHGSGKTTFVAFNRSFHGRTLGALSVTGTEKYRTPFEPLIPGVRFLPFNDVSALDNGIAEDVCAVILEPVQGEGGLQPASIPFLQAARRICDERGILLICDEVQCGLGRTGSLWAYEQYGIVPDMMTLAKLLAAGLPMGAVLMTERVAECLQPGDHGSTFAGGPLVCQVAQVVLNRVSNPEFLSDVREKGAYLETRLRAMAQEVPMVREVRGKGLMWGLEIDGDAPAVVAAGYNHGVMVCIAGANVVRLLPPLIISHDEIDQLADRLLAALWDVEGVEK